MSKLFDKVLSEASLGQRSDDVKNKRHKYTHAYNEEDGFKSGFNSDAITRVFNTGVLEKNKKEFIEALQAWMDKFYPGENFEISTGYHTIEIRTPDDEMFFSKLDKDYLSQLKAEKERLYNEYETSADSLVADLEKYAKSLIGKKIYVDFKQSDEDVRGNYVLPFGWEPNWTKNGEKTSEGSFRMHKHTRHGGMTKDENDNYDGNGYTIDDIKDWKWEIVDVKPVGHPGEQENPWEMFGYPEPLFDIYLKDPEGRTTYPSNYDGHEVPIHVTSKFVDWERSGITDPKDFEFEE